jgi:hypothetical protein
LCLLIGHDVYATRKGRAGMPGLRIPAGRGFSRRIVAAMD